MEEENEQVAVNKEKEIVLGEVEEEQTVSEVEEEREVIIKQEAVTERVVSLGWLSPR